MRSESKKETKVLGVNAGHDSSICMLEPSGKINYALGEERFNRIKAFTGWPYDALSTVPPGNYHIAIANQESVWKSIESRYQKYLFAEGIQHFDIYNERSWAMSFGSRKKINAEPIIQRKLEEQGIIPASISYYDHHLCHAASAYYTSGFRDALVVTADGAGDGRSATAFSVRNGEWVELSSTDLPHSPGHMYG